jgi:hypothetical protein
MLTSYCWSIKFVFAREDGAGAVVGAYYLRPNSLRLGAHVANAGYVVAAQAARRPLLTEQIKEREQRKGTGKAKSTI